MITSRQNERIKNVRALKDKKERDATGLFTVEGIKLVKEAIKLFSVSEIVGTKNGLNAIGYSSEITVTEVSEDVFKSLSNETSPEGVMAVVKKPTQSLSFPKGNCVFLDRVSDPANVGAILRTAGAVGITDIYCYSSADPYSPKSVRASMGGIFRVNVHVGEKKDLLSAIDKPIIVADMKGENVFNFKYSGKFCLIIGNEANGIEEDILKIADYKVSIPMKNNTESLNASVSFGILAYVLQNKQQGE